MRKIADLQTTTFPARFGAPSPLLLTLAIAGHPTAAIALLVLTTLLWATVELAHSPTAVALVVARAAAAGVWFITAGKRLFARAVAGRLLPHAWAWR